MVSDLLDEAPNLPNRRVCIFDAGGQIVAADAALRDWMIRRHPGLFPWQWRFEHLFGDERVIAAALTDVLEGVLEDWSGEAVHPAVEPIASVFIQQLHSAGGRLAVVSMGRDLPSAPSAALDALTQLPDRRAIAPRVDLWRQAAAPHGARFAVLFLDLDDFKRVNDSHGHAIGDRVLQALSRRWLGCVRDSDLVARYGGDEFVLLIQGAATDADIEPVVRRLEQATQAPIDVDGLPVVVTAAVGWSTADGAHCSLDDLVARADRHMYVRKRR